METHIRPGSVIPILCVLVAGVGLFAFSGIGERSIWLDEAYSVHVASQNFEGIIDNLKLDSGPPLYYLILSFWIRCFGVGEFAVRSLSGVFYILSTGSIYLLAKSTYRNSFTAALCTFLYMMNNLVFSHAQNARMYSLLALLGILSSFFYVRIYLLDTRSRADSVFYVFINILGTFTHYWFFFILFAQMFSHVLLFAKSQTKRLSVEIASSVVPFLILWCPIVQFQNAIGVAAWMQKPDMSDLLRSVLGFYGGGPQTLPLLALFLIIILVRIDGSETRLQNSSVIAAFIRQKEISFFLLFLLISIFFPWIVSQIKPVYAPARGPIVAAFPCAMLLGALLGRFGNRVLLIVACYVLLSGAVTAKYGMSRSRSFSNRTTASHLVKYAHENDIIIFTSLSRAPIDYYFRLMQQPDTFIEITFPKEVDLHPGWLDAHAMLNRKDYLESEADELTNRLIDLTKGTQRNIWLLYGSDVRISRILKARLDHHFRLKDTRNLRGDFHKLIYIYESNSA